MRQSGTSTGFRPPMRLRAVSAAMAARAMLLVALGLALMLKGEGAQAADRVLAPERRVALVIGNSNYVNFHPSLPNPRNDAEDVSAALRGAGFEVFLGIDLTKKGMEDLMQRFARAANGADAALTYYAGHGLQYQGRNYLVPVDAKIEDEIDIEYQTTKVNDLVVGLSRAKGVRIIILDACRNLPLEERANRSISVDTGLARISGRGLVVAYATQANALAYDGVGRNSLFTDAFLQAMNEPGLDLPQFFQRVSTTVDHNSDRRQTPELSLSYPGQFFFNRSETAAEAWGRVRDGGDPEAYREFIRKYPTNFLADAARARLTLIEEENRRKAAEADRERQRKQDEMARQRKQEDEARQRKQDEDALRRKQAADDDARRRLEAAEDARRRRLDEERAEQERVRKLAEDEALKRQFEEEVNRRVAERERQRRVTEERQRREAEERQARKPDPVERQYAMLPQGANGPAPDGRDLGNSRNAATDTQKAPPDKTPPETPFPSEALRRDRLHRETEAELGRIGCLREGADTEWNDISIAALGRYGRQAGLSSIPDQPTQELLETLRRQPAHFCPIECGAGQRASGDACIAVTKPELQPKPPVPEEPKATVRKKPKPEAEEAPEPKQAVRKKPKPEPKEAREKPEPRHQAARPAAREPREVERPRPRPAPAVAARPAPAPRPVAAPRPAPAPAPPQIPTSTAARPMRGPSMGFGF